MLIKALDIVAIIPAGNHENNIEFLETLGFKDYGAETKSIVVSRKAIYYSALSPKYLARKLNNLLFLNL